MHVLTFDDPTIGQVVLIGPEFIIGRSLECSLTIAHSGISRKHCKLTQKPEGWEIEDLGSQNHTYVNNNLITQPLLLKEGDTLRLDGTFTATYRFDPELTQPDKIEEDTAILEPRLEQRLDQIEGQIDLSFEALERQLKEAEGRQLDVINALKTEIDELRNHQTTLEQSVENNRCLIEGNTRAIAANSSADVITKGELIKLEEKVRKSVSVIFFVLAIGFFVSLSSSVVQEAERRAWRDAIIEALTSDSGPTSLIGIVVLTFLGKYAAPKGGIGGNFGNAVRLGDREERAGVGSRDDGR